MNGRQACAQNLLNAMLVNKISVTGDLNKLILKKIILKNELLYGLSQLNAYTTLSVLLTVEEFFIGVYCKNTLSSELNQRV